MRCPLAGLNPNCPCNRLSDEDLDGLEQYATLVATAAVRSPLVLVASGVPFGLLADVLMIEGNTAGVEGEYPRSSRDPFESLGMPILTELVGINSGTGIQDEPNERDVDGPFSGMIAGRYPFGLPTVHLGNSGIGSFNSGDISTHRTGPLLFHRGSNFGRGDSRYDDVSADGPRGPIPVYSGSIPGKHVMNGDQFPVASPVSGHTAVIEREPAGAFR